MKKNVLLFFLIYQINLFGQIELKEFAPLGAVWSYWDVTFGGNRNFTWVTRPSDTIVQGIKFKRFNLTYVDFVGNENYGYRIIRDKPFTTYFNIVNNIHYIYNEGKIFKYLNMDTVGCKIIPYQDSCFLGDTLCYTLKYKYYEIQYNYKYIVRVYANNKDTILDTAHSYNTPSFSSYLNFLYICRKNDKALRHSNRNNNCGSATWGFGGYREFSCYFDSTVGFIPFGFGFCEFLFKKENASISSTSRSRHIQIIDGSLLLDLSEIKHQSINYKIINALGVMIIQGQTESNRISLENIQKGYYNLIIEIEGIQTIFKFIK